ncbi:MAG: anaerobic ribonucleoside-triphosphate reductase, partial [Spirochaetia bacterium]
GRLFALKVLQHMRDRLADYQEETGDLFNLEATPAESTSYRLAKHDRIAYPDIITSGDAEPFYTNSSQLPVDYTEDIFDALDLQDELQTLYTGGTVFHGFLGEAIEDWHSCAQLVKAVATNYRLPYFTISPTFSVCPIHGYLAGEHFTCPKCAEEKRAEIQTELDDLHREQAELASNQATNPTVASRE